MQCSAHSPSGCCTKQAGSKGKNGTERSLVLSELETRRNPEKNGQSELVSASVLASRKLAASGSTATTAPPGAGAGFKVLARSPSFFAPFNSRPAASSIPSGYWGDAKHPARRDDLHYHRAVNLDVSNLPSTYGITHKFKRGWDGPVLSHRSTAAATHKVDAAGELKPLPLPAVPAIVKQQASSNIVEKPRSLGRVLGSGKGKDGKSMRQPEVQVVGAVVTLAT